MNGEKYLWTATGFVLAASLLAASAAAWLTASHASRQTYDLLNAVCSRAVRQEPETADVLLAALKACMKENSGDAVQNKDAQEMRNGAVAEEYAAGNDSGAVQTEVLSAWGYRVSDFSGGGHMQVWRFAAAGFAAGIFLFFGTFRMRNRAESRRIRDLTEYLEQVNSGKALIRYASGEDDFSQLEDEIYKTVTFLSQTREQAVQARNDFARNLSNIAHQIKTPLTSISLSVQRMEKDFDSGALQHFQRKRLHHIVVGAVLKARDNIRTVAADGQENNRKIWETAAELTAQTVPASVRHIPVQQHHRRHMLLQRPSECRRRAIYRHLHALLFQIFLHRLRDIRIVLGII